MIKEFNLVENEIMTAQDIIELLDLRSLPKEGGYYRETYRSAEIIHSNTLPDSYNEDRSFGTAIYYLLTPETYSALHKLPTDEIFHFYLGDPVIMLQLHPDKTSDVITLGHKINEGQKVQIIVPKGTWQGTFLKEGGSFALMGTTMTPGFDFSDYTGGIMESLLQQYPDQKELIKRLSAP